MRYRWLYITSKDLEVERQQPIFSVMHIGNGWGQRRDKRISFSKYFQISERRI